MPAAVHAPLHCQHYGSTLFSLWPLFQLAGERTGDETGGRESCRPLEGPEDSDEPLLINSNTQEAS